MYTSLSGGRHARPGSGRRAGAGLAEAVGDSESPLLGM